MQTSKEHAHRFHIYAVFEAENVECGHEQVGKPAAAFCYCPQSRLWRSISAVHSLCELLHTALGLPGLLGKRVKALGGIVTKTLENLKTFLHKILCRSVL